MLHPAQPPHAPGSEDVLRDYVKVGVQPPRRRGLAHVLDRLARCFAGAGGYSIVATQMNTEIDQARDVEPTTQLVVARPEYGEGRRLERGNAAT